MKKSTIELNVCEDIDLRRDILGVQIWQDGNLAGLNQDTNFKKWITVSYNIHLKSADGSID